MPRCFLQAHQVDIWAADATQTRRLQLTTLPPTRHAAYQSALPVPQTLTVLHDLLALLDCPNHRCESVLYVCVAAAAIACPFPVYRTVRTPLISPPEAPGCPVPSYGWDMHGLYARSH